MKLRTFILLMLSLMFGVTCMAAENITIKRIEPSSWWIGMKNPALQILVYGSDISTTDVVLNIPGVKLVGLTRVENKNYLFINLNINSKAKSGNYQIGFFKGKQMVATTTFQ